MPNISIPFAQSVLVDLDLDKVSLCNQGANSRAHILLAKRKENEAMPKTYEELMEVIEPAHAELIKNHVIAEMETSNATITRLETEVGELKAEVENLAKSKDEGETNKDDILKNASPELAAYITELQKSVNTLVADKEEAIAKARFDAVKALPVEEETLKNVLKSASPAVFDILKKAATAIEETVLTNKGKELPGDQFDIGPDALYTKLEKSARNIMAEDETMTFEQAFTEACNRDPETYTKYYTGGAK